MHQTGKGIFRLCVRRGGAREVMVTGGTKVLWALKAQVRGNKKALLFPGGRDVKRGQFFLLFRGDYCHHQFAINLDGAIFFGAEGIFKDAGFAATIFTVQHEHQLFT